MVMRLQENKREKTMKTAKAKGRIICGVCKERFDDYADFDRHYKNHPSIDLSIKTKKILTDAESRVEGTGHYIHKSSEYLGSDATGIRNKIGLEIEQENLNVEDVVKLLFKSGYVLRRG